MRFTIHADGGARGNPGPAGSGAIVYDAKRETILEVSEYLGETTNNVAEYTAIIRALAGLADALGERSKQAEVLVEMDSQLVVKQMRGEYKIKHPNMKPLAAQVKMLVPRFGSVVFKHIPREENADADALANAAMVRGC
jgi:probable phosphoglycerate mutase